MTLEHFVNKYKLDLNKKSPINIPILRDEMAKNLDELNFKTGVEVGTWQGEHAEILCRNIPGLHLSCVDPWTYYRGFIDYHSHDYEPAFEKARNVLKGYDVTFIRKYSLDAASYFKDRSLDFVYIDANHDFRHLIDDVDTWKNKVKRGGIIYGHDYHKSPHRWQTNQVYYAIQSYLYANRINPWFTLGVEDVNLPFGNGVKSWMFIK